MILKYAGIIVTVLTFLCGGIYGYADLQNKVKDAENKFTDLKVKTEKQEDKITQLKESSIRQETNQEAILKALEKIDKRLEKR